MKLKEETLEYLRGKKFSNRLLIEYDYRQSIPDRIELLCDLVRGKSVIHLGCLDHLPLIDDKIRKDKWLHKALTNASSRCLGIDINEEAREYVKTKYGFDNIILGDFTKTTINEVVSAKWNFAILGELLEHIDNPVHYLAEIKSRYAGSLERIIVTVPNAWTRTTIRYALRSSEIINSDHRYWFTPYTLAQVMMQAGLEIDEILFANRVPLSSAKLIERKLLKWVGREQKFDFTYASSIVVVARL